MSKISIPTKTGENIVGILEKKEAIDVGRTQPRLVLICHGVLGHKDYLFHRLLAQQLVYTSFRLDFRGNGESTGQPGYANMEEDTEDLHTVTQYFENLGYEIFAIIGHSRGSVAALKFATEVEKPLPFLVNVSGRYKMNDNQIYRNRPEIGKGLADNGYFDWRVKQRDRIVTVKVTQQEVDRFYNYSNEHVSRMPMATCVLTCHGLKDNIVPTYNAAMFANKIPNHTLALIPEGDHNFKGHFEEVVDAITNFFAKHENDDYKRQLSIGQNTGLVIPRWIDVDGVKNFRDIGGWPVKNGSGYIRERIVFRSGHLSNVTGTGRSKLNELNVKDVFDLRMESERTKDSIMPQIDGIKGHHFDLYQKSIQSHQDLVKYLMGFLEEESGFAKGYEVILESGKELIGDILRHMVQNLSSSSRNAMIVHCTAGKDRTGVFIMLLLGLCGVDDEIIAREYGLSSIGHYEPRVGEIAKNVGVSVEEMSAALGTSYGGMLLTIKTLREKYGSFEGYARDACGLSMDEINALRKLLIVPIKFEERQLYRPKM